MTYVLGKKSLDKLSGVHPDLVRVIKRAIQITKQDFTITEGVRSAERQAELYAQGRTKPGKIVTQTMNSKHRIQKASGYGEAVDAPPFPIDWSNTPENLARFERVADAVLQAALEEGVPVRWGGDWDRDGKRHEKGEHDSPHFELWRG